MVLADRHYPDTCSQLHDYRLQNREQASEFGLSLFYVIKLQKVALK